MNFLKSSGTWLLLIMMTLVMGYFLGLMISTTVDYRLKNFTLDIPTPINRIIISKKDLLSNKKTATTRKKEHFNNFKNSHKASKVSKATKSGKSSKSSKKEHFNNFKTAPHTKKKRKQNKNKKKTIENFVNIKDFINSDKGNKKKLLNTCDSLFTKIQEIKTTVDKKYNNNVDYKNTIEKDDLVNEYSSSMKKSVNDLDKSNKNFNILAYNKNDISNMYEFIR
tara:strand:+ start:1371 stop:2039 length:669 start_codon:yes stop_codon:yes gene_type:complete